MSIKESMDYINELANKIKNRADVEPIEYDPIIRDLEYGELKRNKIYTERELEEYLDNKERSESVKQREWL